MLNTQTINYATASELVREFRLQKSLGKESIAKVVKGVIEQRISDLEIVIEATKKALTEAKSKEVVSNLLENYKYYQKELEILTQVK